MSRTLTAILLTALVSACGGGGAPGDVPAVTVDPAELPAAVAPIPDELPDVVARVNGVDLARADLELAVGRIEAQFGGFVPEDQYPHVVRGALDQMIAYELLTQEARRRGIAAPAGEVDTEVAAIRARFPSEETWVEALAAQQATPDSFRAETERQMVVGLLLDEEVVARVTVSDDDVTAFYENNPDQFAQGAQVRASHILIAFPEEGGAEGATAARTQAEEILAELGQGGDFGALARQFSDDPGSAAAGGDLGYFGEGAMVPPFEAAAFSLAPGETSGLVETQFGYHIIRVVDRVSPRTIPLNDVRPQVQQFLEGQRQQEVTQEFIDTLRAGATIDVLF